jgi:hypothetical protein
MQRSFLNLWGGLEDRYSVSQDAKTFWNEFTKWVNQKKKEKKSNEQNKK